MATKNYSAQRVAETYGIDGLSFRRHLRAQGIRVGKGRVHKFDSLRSSETLSQLRGYFAEVQGQKVSNKELKAIREGLTTEAPQVEETSTDE